MTYSSEDIQDILKETGEVMVVLESGMRYDLHIHDTDFFHDANEVSTEGMTDGEYVFARFPAKRVEHVRWHKES